jgi:hypothetical protein
MNNDKLHSKKPGFTTPKNYFDQLESKIMEEVVLTSKVSKENPFNVPDNYFEELDLRIVSQISEKEKQPKVISIFKNTTLRYVAGIAAAVLLFVSIFQFQHAEDFNNDYITDISNYIDSGYLDFSYLDFETLLTDEMMDGTSFFSTINQDALFEYLSNDFDESLFMYE